MKDKFVWSLISAVGIFCLGAGVTVIHGFHNLFMQQQLEHLAAGLTGNLSAAGAATPQTMNTVHGMLRVSHLVVLSGLQPYPVLSMIEVTATQLWLKLAYTRPYLEI